MSEDASASAAGSQRSGPGFLGNLFGLYFGPKEAFVNIVKRPSFWVPLLLFVAIQLAFTGVWLSQDGHDGVPARTRPRRPGGPSRPRLRRPWGSSGESFWAIAGLAGPDLHAWSAPRSTSSSSASSSPGEVTFKQAMAIVTHTFLATALVTHAPRSSWSSPSRATGTWPRRRSCRRTSRSSSTRTRWPSRSGRCSRASTSSSSGPSSCSPWASGWLRSGATGSAFWGVAIPWVDLRGRQGRLRVLLRRRAAVVPLRKGCYHPLSNPIHTGRRARRFLAAISSLPSRRQLTPRHRARPKASFRRCR